MNIQLTLNQKYQVKSDTFYYPTEKGVYLKNNNGSLTLKGKNIYEWIVRLLPILNGDYYLDEIIEKKSEKHREKITGLIMTLFDHGFLKVINEDEVPFLPAAVKERHADLLQFIDYYCDFSEKRFEKYRQSKMLLIGCGLSLTALASALLDSGIQNIKIINTEENPNTNEKLNKIIKHYKSIDPSIIVHQLTLQENINSSSLNDVDADHILLSSDRITIEELEAIDLFSKNLNKSLYAAINIQNYGILTPVNPTFKSPVISTILQTQEKFLTQPSTENNYSGTSAAILGNLLTFELFKKITGCLTPELTDKAYFLNLGTRGGSTGPVYARLLISKNKVAVN